MAEKQRHAQISVQDFRRIESDSLPIAQLLGISLRHLGAGWAQAVATCQAAHLRPGGTVSGPVMMALADYVAYAAVLSEIGPVELTVTSNLNINFLRKPRPADLIAHGDVLRAGRRFIYTNVQIYSDAVTTSKPPATTSVGDDTVPVSHADSAVTEEALSDAYDMKARGLLVAQASVIYAIPA